MLWSRLWKYDLRLYGELLLGKLVTRIQELQIMGRDLIVACH